MTGKLPPLEAWGLADPYDEYDNTLPNLELALDQGVIAAMTIGRSGDRYQVSVRRDTDGWEVYYGLEIADAIARAVMAGPQLPPAPVGTPPAPWQKPQTAMQMANNKIAEIKAEMLTKSPPIDGEATDNGVTFHFDSEGIEPL